MSKLKIVTESSQNPSRKVKKVKSNENERVSLGKYINESGQVVSIDSETGKQDIAGNRSYTEEEKELAISYIRVNRIGERGSLTWNFAGEACR